MYGLTDLNLSVLLLKEPPFGVLLCLHHLPWSGLTQVSSKLVWFLPSSFDCDLSNIFIPFQNKGWNTSTSVTHCDIMCPASLRVTPVIFLTAENITFVLYPHLGYWQKGHGLEEPSRRMHNVHVAFWHQLCSDFCCHQQAKEQIHGPARPTSCWGWRMTCGFWMGSTTQGPCTKGRRFIASKWHTWLGSPALPLPFAHPPPHTLFIQAPREQNRGEKLKNKLSSVEKAKRSWPESLQSSEGLWFLPRTLPLRRLSHRGRVIAPLPHTSPPAARQSLKHKMASDLKGNYLFTLLWDVFN